MSFLSINPILYCIRILNIIPAGAAMGRHIKFDRLIIAIILPISLLLSCVSKENIKVPPSEPMPHPMLARMLAPIPGVPPLSLMNQFILQRPPLPAGSQTTPSASPKGPRRDASPHLSKVVPRPGSSLTAGAVRNRAC